jgi:hypothetical protein
MNPKFKFYEVVGICGNREEFKPVAGRRAAVLGMSECDDGRWIYSVSILDSGETWCIEESELVPTGALMRREDFYDGSSVSVLVDSDTGEGRVSRVAAKTGTPTTKPSPDEDRDTHK